MIFCRFCTDNREDTKEEQKFILFFSKDSEGEGEGLVYVLYVLFRKIDRQKLFVINHFG